MNAMTALMTSPLLHPAPRHLIVGTFDSPIPLWVFLIAAGATILVTALYRTPAHEGATSTPPPPTKMFPMLIARILAFAGPVAIVWVIAQGLIGGSSIARVDVLFLWHAGWVVVPVLAALGLPIYPLMDPWRRLSLLLRRNAPRELPVGTVAPARSGIAGVAAIIALELIWTGGRGGPALFVAVLIHGAWVVSGRLVATEPERWAAAHDPVLIVNRFLGDFSRRQLVGDPDAAQVQTRAQPTDSSSATTFALTALLVGAVIYDGLSQTEVWFQLFGLPTSPVRAVLLIVVVATVGLLSLLAARSNDAGQRSTAEARARVVAGLRPVAIGYILAHYGPSIVAAAPYWLVAVADPLQRGWNLFGLAYVASNLPPLPGLAVWGVQVGAVVGGHVAGIRAAHQFGLTGRRSQIATALLLVTLTMLTLWTLGQAVVASS